MPKLEITSAVDGLDMMGWKSLTIKTEYLISLRYNELPNTPGTLSLGFGSHGDIVLACTTAAQTAALYVKLKDAM